MRTRLRPSDENECTESLCQRQHVAVYFLLCSCVSFAAASGPVFCKDTAKDRYEILADIVVATVRRFSVGFPRRALYHAIIRQARRVTTETSQLHMIRKSRQFQVGRKGALLSSDLEESGTGCWRRTWAAGPGFGVGRFSEHACVEDPTHVYSQCNLHFPCATVLEALASSGPCPQRG